MKLELICSVFSYEPFVIGDSTISSPQSINKHTVYLNNKCERKAFLIKTFCKELLYTK